MTKTFALSSVTAAAIIAVSAAVATPAVARPTAYYQQTVSGSSLSLCNAAAQTLIQAKQAEGYLVTFVGCGLDRFQYTGLVGWSD